MRKQALILAKRKNKKSKENDKFIFFFHGTNFRYLVALQFDPK